MENRLEKAIKYAMDHMPMKHYAVIVAKPRSEMDWDENEFAVNKAGEHKFYASISITVGKTEVQELGHSDCDLLGAVCSAFAKLHSATVNNRSQFKVAEEFASQFLAGMAQE